MNDCAQGEQGLIDVRALHALTLGLRSLRVRGMTCKSWGGGGGGRAAEGETLSDTEGRSQQLASVVCRNILDTRLCQPEPNRG